jgi:hypothetical protein
LQQVDRMVLVISNPVLVSVLCNPDENYCSARTRSISRNRSLGAGEFLIAYRVLPIGFVDGLPLTDEFVSAAAGGGEYSISKHA